MQLPAHITQETPNLPYDIEAAVTIIAEMIDETQPAALAQIGRIVQHLGIAFAREILAETQRIESQGGMLIQDGSRRRTPGGVFFYLTRQRLHQQGRHAELHTIFPPRFPQQPKQQEPKPSSPPPPVQKVRPRRRLPKQQPSPAYSRISPLDTNQAKALSALAHHLGSPPDLYKRSFNPETGEMRLSFFFPTIAIKHYGQAVATASAEANVPISISPYPHQGQMIGAAHATLPTGITSVKASIHHDQQTVRIRYKGSMSQEAIQTAQDMFHNRTGWSLELESTEPHLMPGQLDISKPLPLHHAMSFIRSKMDELGGIIKVSANQDERTLILRFPFPDVIKERYADQVANLAEQTGWNVTIHSEVHQGKLIAEAQQALPESVDIVGSPAIYREKHEVFVRYRGTLDEATLATAQHTFLETTGWKLNIERNV